MYDHYIKFCNSLSFQIKIGDMPLIPEDSYEESYTRLEIQTFVG